MDKLKEWIYEKFQGRGEWFSVAVIVIAVFCAILLFSLIKSCTGASEPSKTSLEEGLAHDTVPGTGEVLMLLRSGADLVTTEVVVRKVAIYDSSKSEQFEWTDLSTWKIGDRKCVVPIEAVLKYGYDLQELTISDIRINEDSAAISIILPQPKIIDAGFKEGDDKDVVQIATKLRSVVGHEFVEQVRNQGFKDILKQDFSKTVGKDIESNAHILFSTMLRNMGFRYVAIRTTSPPPPAENGKDKNSKEEGIFHKYLYHYFPQQ